MTFKEKFSSLSKKVQTFGLALLMGTSLLTQNVSAAETEYDPMDDIDFSVGLTSDTFFGFAPYFNGSYALDDKMDLTVYGIFWSGGTGANWGNWSEFGGGVNIDLGDGLSFNPQLGFVSGSLLSSGASQESVIGDGIVPNFYLRLDQPKLEGEAYFGLYLPLRNEGTETSTFVHYWLNSGYKFTSIFSAGLHYEQLTGGPDDFDDSNYQWLGPYIQFKDKKDRGFVRFTGGTDLDDGAGNNSFYKMTLGFNL